MYYGHAGISFVLCFNFPAVHHGTEMKIAIYILHVLISMQTSAFSQPIRERGPMELSELVFIIFVHKNRQARHLFINFGLFHLKENEEALLVCVLILMEMKYWLLSGAVEVLSDIHRQNNPQGLSRPKTSFLH